MAGDRVIAVCGYGPGISSAVASLWGSKGFKVALLSRTQARVDKAAGALKSRGVDAAAYAVDLSQPRDVKAVLSEVESDLGPITVLFYNPASQAWGDVLTMDLGAVSNNWEHQLTGLIAAVQAVVPGQVGRPGTAILVTGGGLALAAEDSAMARTASAIGAVVIAAGKAAQRNLVFTLAEALAPKGIRVAEVVVTGGVKWSAAAGEGGTVRPEDVAEDFWSLYCEPVGGRVSVTRS